MTQSPLTQPQQTMPSSRLGGVASRLRLVLLALSSAIVLALLGALYGFHSVEQNFQRVSGETLSRLLLAHRLGSEAESIAAFAPRLVIADSLPYLETMELRLSDHLDWLDALIDDITTEVDDPQIIGPLRQGRASLDETLHQLAQSVRERIESQALERRLVMEILRFDHEMRERLDRDDALHQVPLVQWAASASSIMQQSLALLSTTDIGALRQTTASVTEEISRLEALTQALPAGAQWYRDFTARLIGLYRPLPIIGGEGASLTEGTLGSGQLGQLPIDVVHGNALRRNAAVFGSLTNCKTVSDSLTGTTTRLMTLIEQQAQSRRNEVRQRMMIARGILIACGILTIACTVAVLIYLRRSVASRLLALQAVVREVLSHKGHVSSPIPTHGNDEISEIGQAFDYFLRGIALQEQRMAAQGQQLRALLDTAPFPIVVAERLHQTILFANPAAISLLQGRDEPWAVEPMEQAHDLSNLSRVADLLEDDSVIAHLAEQIAQGQAVRGLEVRLSPTSSASRHHQGEDEEAEASRWALLSCTPIEFEQRAAALFTLYDIGPLKVIQNRLEHANRDLQRSNADLEHFAYVASHDLREPLRMVSSYLSLIRRRYGDTLPDDAQEFMGFAYDGAQRMDRMIMDLLEFSRAGRNAATPQACSSQQALDYALKNLEVRFKEQNVQFSRPETLPDVAVHEGELTRLLQNLMANAVNYHHPQRPPVITLHCQEDHDFWRFAVQDNGIGIPADQFATVFQIFRRLNNGLSTSGSGIGLAICQKMVLSYGGRIWVESVEGQGTTFLFTLPKTHTSEEPLAAAPLDAD